MNISFIIPAYNCENTLKECVLSIYQKDNFNEGDEVIIINDASIDTTEDVILKLKSEFPSIVYLKHKINKGTAAAGRNTGIDASSNDLLFCLDADNVLERSSILPLKEFLISNQLDAAAFGEIIFFKDDIGNLIDKRTHNHNITLIDSINIPKKTPSSTGNYLFTKASWMKAGRYFEPSLNNQTLDSWTFAIRQLGTGADFKTLEGTYYYHRIGIQSHYIENKEKGNLSIAALIGLSPFLDQLHPKDVNYIFSKKYRYTWRDRLSKRPLRLRKK